MRGESRMATRNLAGAARWVLMPFRDGQDGGSCLGAGRLSSISDVRAEMCYDNQELSRTADAHSTWLCCNVDETRRNLTRLCQSVSLYIVLPVLRNYCYIK